MSGTARREAVTLFEPELSLVSSGLIDQVHDPDEVAGEPDKKRNAHSDQGGCHWMLSRPSGRDKRLRIEALSKENVISAGHEPNHESPTQTEERYGFSSPPHSRLSPRDRR